MLEKQAYPPRYRLLERIGFNTILGRFLFAAAVMIAATVGVAWIANDKVTRANQVNTKNLTERVNVSHTLRELNDLFWQIETEFQAYMVVPDEALRHSVSQRLDQATIRIMALQLDQWVLESPNIHQATQQLGQDIEKLKEQMLLVMDIRSDPQKLFPNMGIMINSLNPLNMEFQGVVANAIHETESQQVDPQQIHVLKLFNDIRIFWAQRINTFRVFATTRVGMFNNSMTASLHGSITDIQMYDQMIAATLDTLKQFDQQGMLTFEQSEALGELMRIRKEWNTHYEQVKVIILSDSKWRRDTPLLRDVINPLFATLWQTMQKISVEMEQRAAHDIDHTTRTADQVSRYLWVLALVVLSVTALGTLIFQYQIHRPIARVVKALRAEAAGDNQVVLPEFSVTEAKHLASAFIHMREQIYSRQEHLQAVLTYAADAIITTDLDGKIESCNPSAQRLFGYSPAEIVGNNIQHLIPDYSVWIKENARAGEHEAIAQRADGDTIPIGLRISAMHVGGRELRLIMVADIRERLSMLQDIQAREQRLRSILDNTAEGIITFNAHCEIENWNKAAQELFGWKESEVLGTTLKCYLSTENDAADDNPEKASLRMQNIDKFIGRETEVIGHHKNTTLFPVSLKVSEMHLDGQKKYTAVITNITERKAMMENLRRLAEHDSLTGLHNRAYFHALLEKTVNDVLYHDKDSCALLYIDLDNFKYINDTLGHAAGDKLLVEISNLLHQRTRRSDLVARLGGDEFVVVLANADKDQISAIAESFRRLVAEYTFHYEGKIVDVGCSIGVALIDRNLSSASDVMSRADLACHLAKRGGRNRVHIFSNTDAQDVHTMSIDIGWSRRIKQAIENNRFVFAAQPVVATRDRRTTSFEILVRMLDDDGSIIMPGGFLPTAERFGLSTDIDAWIIRYAIKHLAYVRAHGNDIRYAINLSGQSITTDVIADLIPAMLDETGLDPGALTFEITETAAIADMGKAVSLLSKLRQCGCLTALDDFGSGMSSFAYLRELPVDIVKIDGRFVKNLANSSVDQAMVKAMNDIAHALGKQTVAEFVENENHFQVLCQLGVDYGQGYHLGKPALLDISAVMPQNYTAKRSVG